MFIKTDGTAILSIFLIMSAMLIYISFLYYRVALLSDVVSQKEKYEKRFYLAEGALQIGIFYSKKYLLSDENFQQIITRPIKLKLDRWPMKNSGDTTNKKNVENYRAFITIENFKNDALVISAQLYTQAKESKLVQTISCLLKRDGQLQGWNIEEQ